MVDAAEESKPFRSSDDKVIMYLRVHYFSSEARRTLERKIKEGEAYGVDGYVVDLRNNAGGVYEEAVAIAGRNTISPSWAKNSFIRIPTFIL